ncbi:MAG: DUF664 domain-containing protein [Mucilaginibacter polytrichastri]|nr:DUF664 domain-containing protein [Mucilaginibacter polytrichastri]
MPEDESLMIGPVKGYTLQIGTLVSMLNYNRSTIIGVTKGMTQQQLDFLIDDHANSIGALLMHLAAVDKYYQVHCFEGREDFNAEEKKEWQAGLELGDQGRKEIKGHDLAFYLDKLSTTRAKTLELLKKKDDKWLLSKDAAWSKEQPVNYYWEWFHVCEHESNHRGQIAFLKSRLPGAKPAKSE